MKKTILSIFMAIVICMTAVTTTYAHVNEEMSLLTTTTCPFCLSNSYQMYCGGTYVDSYTERCDVTGCIIYHVQYTTDGECSNCGYSVDGTHVHVNHTKCDYDWEGCQLDSATGRIKG